MSISFEKKCQSLSLTLVPDTEAMTNFAICTDNADDALVSVLFFLYQNETRPLNLEPLNLAKFPCPILQRNASPVASEDTLVDRSIAYSTPAGKSPVRL